MNDSKESDFNKAVKLIESANKENPDKKGKEKWLIDFFLIETKQDLEEKILQPVNIVISRTLRYC